MFLSTVMKDTNCSARMSHWNSLRVSIQLCDFAEICLNTVILNTKVEFKNRSNLETHPRKLFANLFSRYKLMQRADRHENKDTQRMIKMWTNDCRLCQEHSWPEGVERVEDS